MNDKIKDIGIKPKDQTGELFLVPPPQSKCNHLMTSFEVDVDAGKCWCKACGEEVSPIFVLEKLMHQESRWNRSREAYQTEMKRLKARKRTTCQHCKKMTQISRN